MRLRSLIKNLPVDISKNELVDFVLAMAILWMAAGLYTTNFVFFKIAFSFILVGAIYPKALVPFAILWYMFSKYISIITSSLIIALIFIFLVTPVALVRKFKGIDSLSLLSFKSSRQSGFIIRNHKYSAIDLENPF